MIPFLIYSLEFTKVFVKGKAYLFSRENYLSLMFTVSEGKYLRVKSSLMKIATGFKCWQRYLRRKLTKFQKCVLNHCLCTCLCMRVCEWTREWNKKKIFDKLYFPPEIRFAILKPKRVVCDPWPVYIVNFRLYFVTVAILVFFVLFTSSFI